MDINLLLYILIVVVVAAAIGGIISYAPFVPAPFKQWVWWLVGAVAVILVLLRIFAAAPAVAQIGPGFEPNERCLAFLEAQGIDPDEGKFFSRLPSVCYWRYAGYDCEPEQNPPDEWLRPGGYCENARRTTSLSYDPTAPSVAAYKLN